MRRQLLKMPARVPQHSDETTKTGQIVLLFYLGYNALSQQSQTFSAVRCFEGSAKFRNRISIDKIKLFEDAIERK